MIPSRGLRPAHFASLAPRRSLYLCSNGSRQFSVAARTTKLLSSSRSGSGTAKWTSGTSINALSSVASVRHASWSAPWSWTIPAPNDARPANEIVDAFGSSKATQAPAPQAPEPVITTQTPEMSPETLEKYTTVESTGVHEPPATIEELLVDDAASHGHTALDPNTLVEKAGFLKDLGLDYGWGTTAFYEWMIEHMYLDFGLTWAQSIVASVFAIRVLTLYFNVQSSNQQAIQIHLQPVVKDLMAKIKDAQSQGDEAGVRKYSAQVQKLYKDAGTSPLASLKPMAVQMVLGFGAFRCLRGMATLPVPSLANESWLWVPNLALSDPTWGLPILSGLATHLFARLGGDMGGMQTDGTRILMQYVFPVGMFVVSSTMPAGLQMYFLMSSVTGVAVAYTLRQPGTRRLLRLASWPTPESKTLWTKIYKGEIPLEAIRGPDGQIRQNILTKYQAPTPTPRKAPKDQYRGMKLKAGTVVAHLHAPGVERRKPIDKLYPDRDVDFEDGVPKGEGIGAKIDWYRRNYKWKMVMRRLGASANAMAGRTVVAQEGRGSRARERAEEFERRRRERRR